MITILLGKSASGKDAVMRELRDKFGYEPIVSHTTRPMREHEVEGKDYYFVDKWTFAQMIADNEFIEYRSYNTTPDGQAQTWCYGAKKFDLDEDKNYITILDVDGTKEFVKYFGEENCKVVEIWAVDKIRLSRAKKRGSFDQTEWDRRFNDDEIKFLPHRVFEIANLRIENDGTRTPYEIAKVIHEA